MQSWATIASMVPTWLPHVGRLVAAQRQRPDARVGTTPSSFPKTAEDYPEIIGSFGLEFFPPGSAPRPDDLL